MDVKFSIISENQWTTLKKSSPYASPFQDYGWGMLTTKILGGSFSPVLAQIEGLKWLVPLYKNNPWASKPNEYSIGGIGYGGPLPTHRLVDVGKELEYVIKIIAQLRLFINSDHIKAILYPSSVWENSESSKINLSKTCRIELANNTDTVFNKTLSGNARTAIRKSNKSAVIIREINILTLDEVKEAHLLLTKTQKKVHAQYLTDYDLFLSLSTTKLQTAVSKTFVAIYKGRIIGVASLIYDGNEAFHLFHGWDEEYKQLCSNQALIWHMLCFSVDRGIRLFNMGESHTDSLLKAKLRWGAKIEYVPKIYQ